MTFAQKKRRLQRALRSLLRRPLPKGLRVVLAAVVAALPVGALVLAMNVARAPTTVRIDLVTEQVSFVVRGPDPQLRPRMKFSRLTIPQCGAMTFEGFLVSRVASDGENAVGPSHEGDDRLTCPHEDASITITMLDDRAGNLSDGPQSHALLPNLTFHDGSNVTLSMAEGHAPVLTVDWLGSPSAVDIAVPLDVDVAADFVVQRPGIPAIANYEARRLSQGASSILRLRYPKERGAMIALVDSGEAEAFERGTRFAVDTPMFVAEDDGGLTRSALLRDAVVTYPDLGDADDRPSPEGGKRVVIPWDHGLLLRRLEGAHVGRFRLEHVPGDSGRAAHWGIGLILEATIVDGAFGAGDRRQLDDGQWTDLRTTYWEKYWTRGVSAAATTFATVFLVVFQFLKKGEIPVGIDVTINERSDD